MKRLQEVLMKDLGWKFLSVAIAVTMWYMVISINQPVDTRTYSTMLQVDGMTSLHAKGLTISNEDEILGTKVNIKIKGQRTALDRLSQRQSDMLRAYIDVSDLNYIASGDTISREIRVSLPNGVSGYEIVGKFPSKMEMKMERLTQKEFPIEPMLTNKKENGKKLTAPILSQNTVLVQGAKSKVDEVAVVRAAVDAVQAKNEGVVEAPLTAYNRRGEVVDGVVLSKKTVILTYGVYDEKVVPVLVEAIGAPATGYRFEELSYNPKSIVILGEEENLAKIDSITLENMDISGKTADVTKNYNISHYLPTGCSLKNPTENTVQVVAKIVKNEGRKISIPSSRITITNRQEGYVYHLPETVSVSLTGSGGDVSALSGTVDVSGLEEGEHSVPILWHQPQGITAAETTVYIGVEKVPASPMEETEEVESEPTA